MPEPQKDQKSNKNLFKAVQASAKVDRNSKDAEANSKGMRDANGNHIKFNE